MTQGKDFILLNMPIATIFDLNLNQTNPKVVIYSNN